MKRIAIFLFLALLTGMVCGATKSLFEKGTDAYRQGNIEEALIAWQSIYDQGNQSGALCYNLGNAYFRLGNTAQAILFYERAKNLLPRDKDVSSNLALARLSVVDRVEAPVRLIIWNWVDKARDFFSLHELRFLFVLFGVMACACIIAAILWRDRMGRTIPTVVVAFWLLLGVLFVWRSVLNARPYAVITVDKVDVKSAPDETAKDVFALHEGLKIRIKSGLAGWVNIELFDGRQGWIPAIQAEKL
jgi:tetratricopeptide (TPR) repeat protein